MNTVTHITLSSPPKQNENDAVTTHPDGKVLSRTFDLEWDFSGQEQGGLLKKPIVSFGRIDIAYRKDIQSTLADFLKCYRSKVGESATRSQVANWSRGLVEVRKILGSSDWASLSDDKVYKRFKTKLKKRIVQFDWSEGTVDALTTAINKLSESNFCLRKPDGRKFRGWVNKETQQAIAIPIGMYRPIIAKALKTVEIYYPYRNSISDAHASAEDIYLMENSRTDASLGDSQISSRVIRRVDSIKHGIPNFKIRRNGLELGRIQCACAVVTLAFSGMRIGELVSMNKDSYAEKEGTKIPILKGEETKREGQVVYETWQTHRVVKDALALAYDSTQFLRDIYEVENNLNLKTNKVTEEVHQRHERQLASAFLATQPSKITSSYCKTNWARLFNQFIQSSGIIATISDVEEFNRLNPSRKGHLKVGETLPKLTPHDFRRSFAVFFKRYGFGSSATIKFQYKHTNIQMSEYYGNNARLQSMEDVLLDNDLLNLMNEEGICMGVDIFDEIYNESEHLGGAGGERIAKDKFERLSSGEHVYMTRSEIERLVRNGTLSVVKLPSGGYCTNATCSRVCGIGEFSAEIKPCDHEVITDKQAKIILKQNKRLIKAFREMNTGDPMMNSILIGQKQKIQRNEQKIKDFNLTFEPFTDKVKGAIETVEV